MQKLLYNLSVVGFEKPIPIPINQDYQNDVIYLDHDSLKIFNVASLICSGDIIKEKKILANYLKALKPVEQ